MKKYIREISLVCTIITLAYLIYLWRENWMEMLTVAGLGLIIYLLAKNWREITGWLSNWPWKTIGLNATGLAFMVGLYLLHEHWLVITIVAAGFGLLALIYANRKAIANWPWDLFGLIALIAAVLAGLYFLFRWNWKLGTVLICGTVLILFFIANHEKIGKWFKKINLGLGHVFMVLMVVILLVAMYFFVTEQFKIYLPLFLATYAFTRLTRIYLGEKNAILRAKNFQPKSKVTTRNKVKFGRELYWQKAKRLIFFDYAAIFAALVWFLFILKEGVQ